MSPLFVNKYSSLWSCQSKWSSSHTSWRRLRRVKFVWPTVFCPSPIFKLLHSFSLPLNPIYVPPSSLSLSPPLSLLSLSSSPSSLPLSVVIRPSSPPSVSDSPDEGHLLSSHTWRRIEWWVRERGRERENKKGMRWGVRKTKVTQNHSLNNINDLWPMN